MDRIDSLEVAARDRANVRVECGCGHAGIIDAERTCRWFKLHRWDTRFPAVLPRLKCSRCGGRPERLASTHERPTARDRFPRGEAAWGAVKRRLRD